MTLVIILNFKTYKQSTGRNAVELAKIADKVAKSAKGFEIFVAVQPSDINAVACAARRAHVLAQHIDPVAQDRNTGFVVAEAVAQAGAVGTLLNHSEHQMKPDELAAAVKRCREAGLTSFVFGAAPSMLEKISRLKPDAVVLEPPELVGGKISVTKAKPGVVEKSVDAVKSIADIPVLCGAGIKTAQDAAKAVELGAIGIAVSSGFVLAKDPKKALVDFIIGMSKGQNKLSLG